MTREKYAEGKYPHINKSISGGIQTIQREAFIEGLLSEGAEFAEWASDNGYEFFKSVSFEHNYWVSKREVGKRLTTTELM